jgi:hypothetical protein
MGLTKPPSYTYDCSLETQEKNYIRRVQISQTEQAGEADRFLIRFGIAQSSLHRFQAKLRDVSGVEFVSPRIELRSFVPRSRQKAVESKIQI